MTSKDATKKAEFRKAVAEQFLHLIDQSEDDYQWQKSWACVNTPYNLTSNKKYRGINSLFLMIVGMENKWKDPRWITIAQMNKAYPEARVKKGEKHTKVEFCTYFMKDETGKRVKVSPSKMFSLLMSGEKEWKDFSFFHTYWHVFNAEQCTGLPALEETAHLNKNVTQNEFVSNISKNLGVQIIHGGDQAFYKPSADEIHLPNMEQFKNNYAYNSTALHELAHSTGCQTRLNRDIKNIFGSEDYAFEELVAELTSCMTSTELVPNDEGMEEYLNNHSKNHLAYLKSWSMEIKQDPTILEKAYKLAEQATDYMDFAGGKLNATEFKQLQPRISVKLDETGKFVSTTLS